MARLSRRKFILTAGATAAGTMILHGCSSGEEQANTTTPSPTTTGATTASGESPEPEVTTAKLGFIALTDAAPLFIAKEKGFFDKYGMTGVEVLKQASWGTTRDNIVLGSDGGGIDGGHILTPMPYLITTGTVTQGNKVPMYILARLNTNGQCISVANDYKEFKVTLDSSPLKQGFAKKGKDSKDLKFAMTFPGGTHDLWIRYWLAAGGIDPNKDISLIVVPPAQMVANMKVGNMEAFCVCEPWNKQLISQGIGYTGLTTGELWHDHPEKAFALRADWVDKHPKAAKALLMAVLEAQQWCDKPENKDEMAQIISKREWIKVDPADVIDRAKGNFDYGDGRVVENSPEILKYWADYASYPYKSHDLWFITENIRWGYLPSSTDGKALVDQVNREDLWKEAAQALDVPTEQIPTNTSRGVETFFDGIKFDPENPQAYLDSLKIKSIKA